MASVLIPIDASSGKIRICPQFNLRFLFPAIVEEAIKGLETARWEPWYEAYCAREGVTENDLLYAWGCYAKFAASCLDPEQTSPKDALVASGFLDAKKPAQLVVLGKIGQLVTASLWWPLREGTPMGELPMDVTSLAARGEVLTSLAQGVAP